jgi:hypothetical protein
MASTYSALKIELIGTGEQSGTWGTTTNTNLGDAALGEAITGSADVNYATAADVTVTLTDVNTTQSARNLRLNITESSTGIGYVGNLILGSGCQIEKFYLINNTGTGAKTVKNTSGTGISVPAGKATLVYNNGTNVVDAATYFSSLTLGSALPVASGGTGTTSTTFTNLTTNVTGTLPVANGGTGVTSSTGTVAVVLSNTPTLVTPVLGVATATSVNKVALTAPATGSTLTLADGKTLTASNTLTLAGTDATTMTFPASSATVAGLAIAQSFTAKQTFTGATASLASAFINATETSTISATAATGTINYDVTTQSVLYYTTSASANWTVNIRGNATTSLNTLMSTNDSLTVVFLVTQGSTAYYNNAFTIDGNSVTPKYQGGTAWTSGNASGIDAYSYTIVKTGSAAFTVFAAQTQFK